MKQEHNILLPAVSIAAATLLSKYTLSLGLKSSSNHTPWEKTERATFTLLWTGKKHLFVTCFHVLKKLREIQKQDSSAQIVAYAILPPHLAELNSFRLVDYNERIDVAVFCGLADIVEIPGAQFIDYQSSYLRAFP